LWLIGFSFVKIQIKQLINMTEHFDIEIPKEKIYSDRALWVGSFIGGPLVAGYLIAENFKVFKDAPKANKTWIITIIGTIIILGGVLLIPDDVNIPSVVIPLVYTSIAYATALYFQKKLMNKHTENGGVFYSWWRVIGIALLGLVFTVLPVLAYSMIVDLLGHKH
jgi:fucose permease